MTQAEFDKRYYELGHAIQSGIAYLMGRETTITDPKHLRVGIDIAHVTDHAIAELLMAKGIFTMDEYRAQLLKSMQDEVDRTTARIEKLTGAKVVLG